MSCHRFASFIRSTRAAALSALVMAGVSLSACGPLNNDDTDPTAASEAIEQPTDASTGEATETDDGDAVDTETPADAQQDSASPSVPQPFEGGTPVLSVETEPTREAVLVSTPVLDLEGNGLSGTPLPGSPSDAATPVGSDQATTDASGEAGGDDTSAPARVGESDGTSGATPDLEQDDSASENSDSGASADTSSVGTPGASPAAIADLSLQDLEPVVVTSCDPEVVPAITIEQVDYLTNADVNFRTGPGAECDQIGTGPIGVNTAVTLIGGPVATEEDGFVWVQVEIAGETGWIVVDVLEPAV